MPTLNLDPDFPDHPKTVRLRGRIGATAESCLLRLWCYACKHHPEDGEFRGYTAAEVESMGGWVGEPGTCLAAMVAVRFVDELRDDAGAVVGYALHNWRDRQGHLPVYRARARANAQKRWAKVRARTAEIEAAAGVKAAPALPAPAAPVEQKPALRGVKLLGSNASSNATSIARSNAMAGHGMAGQVNPPKPPAGGDEKLEKRKRAKASGDGVCLDAIPQAFRTDRIIDAWRTYCRGQAEKHCRMYPTRAAAQWGTLAPYSEPEAFALIKRAIPGGWQSIVYEKDSPGNVLGANRMPVAKPAGERSAAATSEVDAAGNARRVEAMRVAKDRADVFAAVAALPEAERERRRLSAIDAAQTVQRSIWAKADPMMSPGLASAMLSIAPPITPNHRNP